MTCKIERIDYVYGGESLPSSQTFTLEKCAHGVTLPSSDFAKEYYQYDICQKGNWFTGWRVEIKTYERSISKPVGIFLRTGKITRRQPVSEMVYSLDEIADGVSLHNRTTLQCD